MIVLIPAKNEEATVAEVVREVKARYAGEVLVIDDASTDRTAEQARAAGAEVLSLAFSLGAWGAIQTGLRYALRHGYQTAITMDADGQHQADSVAALWETLQRNEADVAVGSFPQRGSRARRLAWSLFRGISGLSLEDLTSGLRAYNRKAIRLLASQKATLLDYQDMGVLLLLHSAGLRIVEVPTVMNSRQAGHSRIFRSWWAVGGYMFHTLTLCTARASRVPFFHRLFWKKR